MHASDLERAAALVQQADLLIAAAGAGIGVDSGLPDFRGNEGFWKAYPALAQARMAFSSVASPSTFHEDPALAWGFYGHRLNLYRATVPHEGFRLLKQWGERMEHGYGVFTSNVDGQFQLAGFDPQRIHECHGSIHHLQCLQPCGADIWRADAYKPQVDNSACQLMNAPPTCPHCGGLARPNILMFGDGGWIERRAAAQEARLSRLLRQAERPLVIELGAGVAIPSVRYFGQSVVSHYNGRMVRINPREPQVASPRDVGLAAGSLQALSAINALL
ncbi:MULTISPECIES: Sir2 family NAD-dependent protein deacetylase [unclassified Duganella]|uniref:SIR2 family NAD-dependent protein deacylase n=1 Tax=unclassified Duganella TaxID=2636909 RepID=UPI0008803C74|nr:MULTISPECIES: Sir2 family NAD-dependent protein deacetylase [unclassified Duganella]SDF42318.1 NAD-dependent protein deacetylase, SIR2 family [Duganella sp. OV458]SDI84232.1 NAD-dependent protein deacetylase, SIR2 family [Duganella sp. OV510]